MHRKIGWHSVTNVFGVRQGGNKIQNMLKLQDFHYLSSYNWKNEGVTTKSLNSNINKNVFRNEVHRNNRVTFCNKWVWGTPGG